MWDRGTWGASSNLHPGLGRLPAQGLTPSSHLEGLQGRSSSCQTRFGVLSLVWAPARGGNGWRGLLWPGAWKTRGPSGSGAWRTSLGLPNAAATTAPNSRLESSNPGKKSKSQRPEELPVYCWCQGWSERDAVVNVGPDISHPPLRLTSSPHPTWSRASSQACAPFRLAGKLCPGLLLRSSLVA